MNINKNLLWDYSFTKQEQQSEKFKKWYLGRVLSHGSSADIKTVDTRSIKKYLPVLNVPSAVRKFWQWYFSYEPTHTTAKANN